MLKLTYTILNCILRIESTLFSLDVPVDLPTTPGLTLEFQEVSP